LGLNAVVYHSRATLSIDVESLGAVRNDLTGEYYFSTPEHDGEFPREVFIAREFWIGNVEGVAELRDELSALLQGDQSILLEKCFYSGSHSGDLIDLVSLSALESEISTLLERRKLALSQYLLSVLRGMLELVETAKAENNPIVFV
jgi:hypothetical protein